MTCAHQQMGHWLAELNANLGVAMSLNDEGFCRMRSETGLELTLLAEPFSNVFRVFIDLIPIPLENPLFVYETCLRMNLDQGYTGGASIAVDLTGHAIVLSYMREVGNTTFIEFQNLLQNLLDIANRAKSDLSTQDEEQPEQSLRDLHSTMLQV